MSRWRRTMDTAIVSPGGGEFGRAVGHPVDEAELVEPFEHLGGVGLRRAEALGELGRRHRVPAPLAR